MAKIYRDEDVKTNLLRDKTISVIGYGSQGRAQALNLRDDGLNVIVGLRKGKSWEKAVRDGFKVVNVENAADKGDVVLMLVPDMAQPAVYNEKVKPHLGEGKSLCFAHGFNVHFKLIVPPKNVDVFMVAPKGPGDLVRERYLGGEGVPSLVAVYQDYTGEAKQKALEIAKHIGSTRVGAIETTFAEETETDLIGEQTVLVGGLMELIKKGFEVLVELGYQPEVAYFEALNEAKLIMDLIYERGILGMLKAVSDTAKYGGVTVGPMIIDENVKHRMKEAAEKVLNGEFAREWVEEYKSGQRKLKKLLDEIAGHKVEVVGAKIREICGIKR